MIGIGVGLTHLPVRGGRRSPLINLLTWSEAFDNAIWVAGGSGAVTVSANAGEAPDGTITADRISGLNGFQIRQNIALASQHVGSLYVKADRPISAELTDGATRTVVNIGMAWTRVSHSAASWGRFGFTLLEDVATDDNLLIWGAQLAPTLGPYVKTEGTPKTA